MDYSGSFGSSSLSEMDVIKKERSFPSGLIVLFAVMIAMVGLVMVVYARAASREARRIERHRFYSFDKTVCSSPDIERASNLEFVMISPEP